MLLQRVPQDEGDGLAFDAGSARRAGEGENRASRQSQVRDLGLINVSSMMLMLLSRMNVEMSDLLLDVPTDLALKRQTRSVFSVEKK